MEEKFSELWERIKDYLPENWKDIKYDEQLVKKAIADVARKLPVEVYEVIREEVLVNLFSMEETAKASLAFVVDSNIIIADCFRVASGKYSSIERIFSSAFVRLFAPKSIEKEVYEQIKLDLPKGSSMQKAKMHAAKLLSKITLVNESEFEVEHKALAKFKDKYGNDASFVKVGLRFGIKSVVTKDKDFSRDGIIEPIDLGAAVKTIVSTESGALSLSLIGVSACVVGEGIYWALFLLIKVILEIISYIGLILVAGVKGLVGLITGLPLWLQVVLLSVAIGTGVAVGNSKKARGYISENATKLYEMVVENSKKMIETLEIYLRGLIDMTSGLREELVPYFIYMVVGLIMTIEDMETNLSKYEF